MSFRRPLVKTGGHGACPRLCRYRLNLSCRWALVAARLHGFDTGPAARKDSFNIAVRKVTHPALQAQGPRRLNRPAAVPYTLDPAHNYHTDHPKQLFRVRHTSVYSNSMITSSTARLSPGAAFRAATTPSRSARRIFSIFMASTTARA